MVSSRFIIYNRDGTKTDEKVYTEIRELDEKIKQIKNNYIKVPPGISAEIVKDQQGKSFIEIYVPPDHTKMYDLYLNDGKVSDEILRIFALKYMLVPRGGGKNKKRKSKKRRKTRKRKSKRKKHKTKQRRKS